MPLWTAFPCSTQEQQVHPQLHTEHRNHVYIVGLMLKHGLLMGMCNGFPPINTYRVDLINRVGLYWYAADQVACSNQWSTLLSLFYQQDSWSMWSIHVLKKAITNFFLTFVTMHLSHVFTFYQHTQIMEHQGCSTSFICESLLALEMPAWMALNTARKLLTWAHCFQSVLLVPSAGYTGTFIVDEIKENLPQILLASYFISRITE